MVRLDHYDSVPHIFDSNQFAGEPLRVIERSIILPGSETRWWFSVAAARDEIDRKLRRIRAILAYSFAIRARCGIAVSWCGSTTTTACRT